MTSQPLQRIRATVTHRSLIELVNLANRGDMTLNAPYQRGSVWTLGQRVGLIRSLMLGIPVPALVINDRGDVGWAEGPLGLDEPFYAVIDGKQRIETMIAWFGGELSVPESWFDPAHIEDSATTRNWPGVTYLNLTLIGQRIFARNANIGVCEGKLPTVGEEAEVFCLVNGEGCPLTSGDVSRAAAIAGR